VTFGALLKEYFFAAAVVLVLFGAVVALDKGMQTTPSNAGVSDSNASLVASPSASVTLPSPIPSLNLAPVNITLIKFHGNKQCTSCVNLGKFANSTVNAFFEAEVRQGRIRYLDINIETEPSNPYVVRYSPTYASLFVITSNSSGETFEELAQAWYYTGDEAAYSDYLKAEISKRLE